MTSRSDLITILKKCLGDSKVRNLLSNSNSDLYEAYIFSLILRAAKAETATVYFEDINGNKTTKLLFRTSPGTIYSTKHNYTHAVVEFPNGTVVEVHVGIKISGKSGVSHEADVAVVDRAECETCRRGKVNPRNTKVIFAVECKYYFTHLGIDLARSFLGLDSEFAAKKVYFVSNTSSKSVEKILSKHSKKWDRNVIPRLNSDTERVMNQFRTAFLNLNAGG